MSKRRREAQKQRHDQELADLRSKVEKLQAEVKIEWGRANHYRDQWQWAAQTIDQIKKLIDEAYATIRSLHQARWSEHDGFYTLDAALAKMTQVMDHTKFKNWSSERALATTQMICFHDFVEEHVPTSASHSYVTNDQIKIENVTGITSTSNNFNGTYTITQP